MAAAVGKDGSAEEVKRRKSCHIFISAEPGGLAESPNKAPGY